MKTNNITRLLAGLTALMIAGAVRIQAATTNAVQNINFELTFFAQGPTTHPGANLTKVAVDQFRVTTKDIIAALGAATSNNFSTTARLVSVRDATSTNSARKIEVRDGANIVDVTGFFHLDTAETNVASVHSLLYNSATGIGSGLDYSIFRLVLTNASLTASLDLGGFARTTHTGIKSDGVVLGVDEIDAAVAGSGMGTNEVPAVVTGAIDIKGRVIKIE